MRKVIFFFGFPVLACALSQSLVLHKAGNAVYDVPGSKPFRNLQSYWFDVRIHDYAFRPETCTDFLAMGPGGLQLCDPKTSGGGVFRTAGFGHLRSGNALLVNPPGIQIIGIKATRPAVIVLAASPFPIAMSAGRQVFLYGIGGPGCDSLNGPQTIRAVSGHDLTLSADASGCSSPSGEMRVFVEDLLLRVHVNRAAGEMFLETWNVDGTGYTVSWDRGAVDQWYPVQYPISDRKIGGAVADLAYMRWCSGTVGLKAMPPRGGVADACPGGTLLADWEFEGNGMDSGPHHVAIHLRPERADMFASTPKYLPACNAGQQQSFRVGTPGALDASQSFPLDDGPSLSFHWEQLGSSEPGTVHQQNLTWQGQDTAKPSISGFTAGPVNLKLTIVDSSHQSNTCTIHDGAVSTDAAGHIVQPTREGSKMLGILGPLTRWKSPARWPWADEIVKLWADRLGSFQGEILPGGMVTEFTDTWNMPLPGAVTATKGSRTITGSGTQFQTAFCGGPGKTTPISNINFIGWYNYTLPGGGGGTGRRAYGITQCTSQTTLQLGVGWVPASQSPMQYSVWTNAGVGSWLNGSSSINYYDNVMAFYALYFRTGIDTYLHHARWLADRWWTLPFIDRGNANDCLSNASLCNNSSLFPRMYAFTGLFLRAIDQDMVNGSPGSSPMWPGIRKQVDNVFRYRPSLLAPITDLREQAYQDMFVALCAAYDPDGKHAAACRADAAEALIKVWAPARQPDGHWESFMADFSDRGTPQGHVTVKPGSKEVTIQGETWNPAWFPRHFVSFYHWADPTTRDRNFYNATYKDPSHILLDRPYQGDCSSAGNSCSGRYWALNTTWVGFGTQPFMLGIAGLWFNQAYLALSLDPKYQTQAALAKSYVIDAATWISRPAVDGTGGTDPTTRGAYYGVGFGVCTPGAANGSDSCRCVPNSQSCAGVIPSRELMGEALGELAIAYQYAPSPALKAAIDNVYSAVYAKYPHDPGYDGTYASDLETWFLGTNNPKWFGFFWGMGRNMAYEGVR